MKILSQLILGLVLAFVAQAAEVTTTDRYILTAEQDEFLAANPKYFTYFSVLHDRKTPEQIRTEFKLSLADEKAYLSGLEKISLIKLQDGKPQVTFSQSTWGWPEEGKLTAVFDGWMMQSTLNERKRREDTKQDRSEKFWGRNLTPEQVKELKKEVSDVFIKYGKISKENKDKGITQYRQFYFLLGLDGWQPEFFSKVEPLGK